MQAQETSKHLTGLQKLSGGLLIASAMLMSAIGLSNLTDIEILAVGSGSDTRPATIVAQGSAYQGEGLIDVANRASALPVIRYHVVEAGEGLVDPANSAPAISQPLPIIRYTSPFAGEGMADMRSLADPSL